MLLWHESLGTASAGVKAWAGQLVALSSRIPSQSRGPEDGRPGIANEDAVEAILSGRRVRFSDFSGE
jgi:hypothetical protein